MSKSYLLSRVTFSSLAPIFEIVFPIKAHCFQNQLFFKNSLKAHALIEQAHSKLCVSIKCMCSLYSTLLPTIYYGSKGKTHQTLNTLKTRHTAREIWCYVIMKMMIIIGMYVYGYCNTRMYMSGQVGGMGWTVQYHFIIPFCLFCVGGQRNSNYFN